MAKAGLALMARPAHLGGPSQTKRARASPANGIVGRCDRRGFSVQCHKNREQLRRAVRPVGIAHVLRAIHIDLFQARLQQTPSNIRAVETQPTGPPSAHTARCDHACPDLSGITPHPAQVPAKLVQHCFEAGLGQQAEHEIVDNPINCAVGIFQAVGISGARGGSTLRSRPSGAKRASTRMSGLSRK
jgi:hypothetical protein